jgi:predicted DNA-binding transcriptional regulator AlpA
MKDKSKRLIPDPEVCRRYGVVAYTLWRWDHDPDFDFPKPVRINGRKYRVEDELDQFDARAPPSVTTVRSGENNPITLNRSVDRPHDTA